MPTFLPLPRILSMTLLLGMLGLFSACQYEQIDNSGIVDPVEDASFSADILPILTTSCAGGGCHVGQTTSGVNLSSYDQTLNSVGVQYNQPIVNPGNAADSPLFDKVSANPEQGQRMPFGRSPLSNADIELIRAWIDEGALDN